MENLLLSLVLIALISLVHAKSNVVGGTADGSEQWGYVEVRPKAHMFWWLYRSPYRVEDPLNPWPVILWLQGGPGGSGVGFGNFLEIGPLDANLKPRNSTWLKKADLLFVDSPVGAGFSYVEDENLAVTTDEEAATDLTTLLKELFNGNQSLQKSPLHIFSESYGGKFAATLGVSTLKAIEAGELKLQLGGVALGDGWISPEDFAFSWGPLLKDMSRLDGSALNGSNRSELTLVFPKKNSLAVKIQQQIAGGMYVEASQTIDELENLISANSNNVDFYNFMLDYEDDPVISVSKGMKGTAAEGYSRYLANKFSPETSTAAAADLDSLMNGFIRKKLNIIPDNVRWGAQGEMVSHALIGDFMKPRIEEVDELLAKGTNVTIYNGQVDLICSTKGVEAWLNKLKWDGLGEYLSSSRIPLYCGENYEGTKGFLQSYKNLFFYWILGAGHFVPVEQPCISLQMVGSITRSPNNGS